MRKGNQEEVEAEHIPLAVRGTLQCDGHLDFYDRTVPKLTIVSSLLPCP